MGYNSQSNIMKKLLLLGIATLVALCTACEKDKDEPKDKSTNGIDISTLDKNDPNTYFWKVSYSFNCMGEVDEGIDCIAATTEDLIEIIKEEQQEAKEDGCNAKITVLSKISQEECESLWW